ADAEIGQRWPKLAAFLEADLDTAARGLDAATARGGKSFAIESAVAQANGAGSRVEARPRGIARAEAERAALGAAMKAHEARAHARTSRTFRPTLAAIEQLGRCAAMADAIEAAYRAGTPQDRAIDGVHYCQEAAALSAATAERSYWTLTRAVPAFF